MRGMILAAKYARENKVPYLGICLGMQISVIEFARSVSDLFIILISNFAVCLYISLVKKLALLQLLVLGFGFGKGKQCGV